MMMRNTHVTSNSLLKCVITTPNNKHPHYLDACTPEVVLESEVGAPKGLAYRRTFEQTLSDSDGGVGETS